MSLPFVLTARRHYRALRLRAASLRADLSEFSDGPEKTLKSDLLEEVKVVTIHNLDFLFFINHSLARIILPSYKITHIITPPRILTEIFLLRSFL